MWFIIYFMRYTDCTLCICVTTGRKRTRSDNPISAQWRKYPDRKSKAASGVNLLYFRKYMIERFIHGFFHISPDIILRPISAHRLRLGLILGSRDDTGPIWKITCINHYKYQQADSSVCTPQESKSKKGEYRFVSYICEFMQWSYKYLYKNIRCDNIKIEEKKRKKNRNW